MKRAVLLTALLLVAGPGAAQTAAMDAARAAGQIGERFDGYIGVAAPVPGAVRSQVAAVNIQRRTLYSNLAASRGATPQDVGITAGCQLLGRVPVGGAYMLIDGAWRRRGSGQAPPAPDYCR
jgi:uncharacterized protein YdbL (DUF1318 family)